MIETVKKRDPELFEQWHRESLNDSKVIQVLRKLHQELQNQYDATARTQYRALSFYVISRKIAGRLLIAVNVLVLHPPLLVQRSFYTLPAPSMVHNADRGVARARRTDSQFPHGYTQAGWL